jgi:cardiolipin synthase (CMP-forming)
MNLANRITIIRIFFIPFFITLLIYDFRITAFVLFCIMGITDGVDGFIARARKERTELGSFLDPMADKLLLTTSFITLSVINELPVWLTIIVVSRDLILVAGALLTHILTSSLVISPSILGKVTTFFQIVTISVVLLVQLLEASPFILNILFFTTAFFTIVSGIHYIYLGSQLVNGEE